MELTARLASTMPYRQAASILAEFLPIEPTESTQPYASGQLELASGSTSKSRRKAQDCRWMNGASSKCSFR
ncbi:hypothetical protein AJ88_28495 [Mesorhizobium amorphae CCBAU 01583]|nr:hypothetical protein AJ88_28495 [Mesorhizobium amorphae CCBAU 01583]